MEQYVYDVFISYRRKGGSEMAQLVKSEIRQRGIEENRIFLDTHSLHEGDFEQKIKVAIEQSESVVVIISNGCFDEIKETDYWYMEIKEALIQSKQVVPIFFDGITTFASLNVPKELDSLTRMNAVTYHHEYANAAFDKLLSFIGQQKVLKNSSNRRGCLFSFKYKGCLVSVTLIGLLIFVLVPIALWNSEEELALLEEKRSYGEVAPASPAPSFPEVQEKPIPVPNAAPPSAKSANNNAVEKGELFGLWYVKHNPFEGIRFFRNEVLMVEFNDEGEIINEGDIYNNRNISNYIIEGDSIVFIGRINKYFGGERSAKYEIKRSAKYEIKGNELTLIFKNGHTVHLKKK